FLFLFSSLPIFVEKKTSIRDVIVLGLAYFGTGTGGGGEGASGLGSYNLKWEIEMSKILHYLHSILDAASGKLNNLSPNLLENLFNFLRSYLILCFLVLGLVLALLREIKLASLLPLLQTTNASKSDDIQSLKQYIDLQRDQLKHYI
ncbi:hypothetical protein ACJX0J_039449, partial [Zea mays]